MPDATGRPQVILALDSSAALCAAAVMSGGRVTAAQAEDMTRGQAERLMPLAREVMDEAGIAPDDLSAIAVCIGPGNFTGVRIGVSGARGLALAIGRPAIGVGRLAALAAEAMGADGAPALVAVTTRRDEICAQAFALGPHGPIPLTEPTSGTPETVAALMATALADMSPGIAAGAAAEILAAPFGAKVGRLAQSPSPGTIARLAVLMLASGAAMARPAPIYLRPADAAPSSDRPPAMLPNG
ncbi:MAG: tRNA threonylcarbamoyl adenosine modification protein YeaZ [Paracoccaceae bacterium]|jgi:tRNA threonylcarbamoyladenosine biosynthesis protein TsaB